jgi:hypothetical protein
MEQINAGLKDIFSSILKDTSDGSKSLPTIIVLSGNGHVIAPGGTVHVHKLDSSSNRREGTGGSA